MSTKAVKASDTKAGARWDRVLPDPGICCAKIITGTLAECMVDQPWECPSAVSFGFSHICMHPDRCHIIARTRAAQAHSESHKTS